MYDYDSRDEEGYDAPFGAGDAYDPRIVEPAADPYRGVDFEKGARVKIVDPIGAQVAIGTLGTIVAVGRAGNYVVKFDDVEVGTNPAGTFHHSELAYASKIAEHARLAALDTGDSEKIAIAIDLLSRVEEESLVSLVSPDVRRLTEIVFRIASGEL